MKVFSDVFVRVCEITEAAEIIELIENTGLIKTPMV